MTAPIYDDGKVALYVGHYSDVLPTLDLTGLSCIVTDPPYGETALDWDVWPRGWPATMPGTSMWCFGSMRMFLDRRDDFSSWKLSQDVVWEKQQGTGFATDRFRRIHEHALHWYRGSWSDVHHDTPVTNDAVKSRMHRRQKPTHMGDIRDSVYVSEDGGPRLRGSVIYARNMHGQAINETEKPVALIEPLIHYAAPVGGLVLDPFAGSASTLAAARATGRRAIGIELRPAQAEKAAERLAHATLFEDA